MWRRQGIEGRGGAAALNKRERVSQLKKNKTSAVTNVSAAAAAVAVVVSTAVDYHHRDNNKAHITGLLLPSTTMVEIVFI